MRSAAVVVLEADEDEEEAEDDADDDEADEAGEEAATEARSLDLSGVAVAEAAGAATVGSRASIGISMSASLECWSSLNGRGAKGDK